MNKINFKFDSWNNFFNFKNNDFNNYLLFWQDGHISLIGNYRRVVSLP
jgi:hypothetical protein